MEQAMTATGLGESVVLRVAVIGGATAIAIVALLSAGSFHSTMFDSNAAGRADASRPAANQEPAIEKASFVTSSTFESNPRFFFGSGDNSNGYYAERPEPKLDSVR
jgi:hypothetical protein